MTVAPFPTLARAVQRVTSEVWLAFEQPVVHGDLRSHETAIGVSVIDARDALAHAGDLLEIWLAEPELSCCSLQIGLQIYADGALWTQGTTDHFLHLAGWIRVAESLLDGTPTSTCVWDESTLRTRIEGERAMIWDEQILRLGRTQDGWWPIRVDRIPMARAIAEGLGVVDALRSRLVAALESRFDRNALPSRLDPSRDLPRATERLDKAAIVDREAARSLDVLPIRALRARI